MFIVLKGTVWLERDKNTPIPKKKFDFMNSYSDDEDENGPGLKVQKTFRKEIVNFKNKF